MSDPTLDRALGRIEGEIRGLRGDIAEIKMVQGEMRAQLISLDNWRVRVSGIAATVAAIISFLLTGISHMLKGG